MGIVLEFAKVTAELSPAFCGYTNCNSFLERNFLSRVSVMMMMTILTMTSKFLMSSLASSSSLSSHYP